mgnify:CR=1 FL=1
MRTIPFSQILNEAVQLCGLDRDNLTTKTFKALRDMAGNRLNEIWNREQWPFLVKYLNTIAGRDLTGFSTQDGSSLVQIVSSKKWDYESLMYNGSPALISVDTSIGNKKIGATLIKGLFPYIGSPIDDTTMIVDVGVVQNSTSSFGGQYIGTAWSQSDSSYSIRLPNDCEAVLGVYSEDPRSTTRAVPIGYYLEAANEPTVNNVIYTQYDYAVIKNPLDCWVQYRIACPKLIGDAYSPTATYNFGDQVYYQGYFFNALSYSVGVAPSTLVNSSYWSIVNIPELFRGFLVRAILADYLRSESQFDQAAAAEIDAQANYERAVDFVMRQEQQSGKLNMLFTY